MSTPTIQDHCWGRPAAPKICHAHRDGECHWEQCPQLRDGEPAATGRSCPLPLDPDDIERAVLAARPAVPPAVEPKPGELIHCLHIRAASLMADGANLSEQGDAAYFTRAADQLEQFSAPAPVAVPVAVAERPWEREGWCDGQGHCWFFYPQFNTWSLERPPVALTRGVGRFLSLPHHAIPLPQGGEGELFSGGTIKAWAPVIEAVAD